MEDEKKIDENNETAGAMMAFGKKKKDKTEEDTSECQNWEVYWKGGIKGSRGKH